MNPRVERRLQLLATLLEEPPSKGEWRVTLPPPSAETVVALTGACGDGRLVLESRRFYAGHVYDVTAIEVGDSLAVQLLDQALEVVGYRTNAISVFATLEEDLFL